MTNFISKHLLLFAFIAVLVSCKKDQYSVDTPAYIQIDSFTVSTACFENQSNRLQLFDHNVKDAWVYIDNSLQGTYQLPARFPVLEEGSHKIEIRPGILQNGIQATRAIYPFYEFNIDQIDLVKGETVKIDPCLAYLNVGQALGEIEVAWSEDFEGIVDIEYNAQTDTLIVPISDEDEVFAGNFSGAVFMNKGQSFFEMISPTLTNLPVNGTPIYLEINYRTNHDFFVGLYLENFTEQINLYGFRANDSWNKVYIDLSEPIRFNGDSPNFNIFIGFQKDPDLDNVKLLIDNIKLLHF